MSAPPPQNPPTDPFLLTYRVRDHLYDIGPHISPISIRDQMIRAHTLVMRAMRERIIAPDKPLLIVGAGVAGATAAIAAARAGVHTTVVDKETNTFALQLGCKTRYLDPTQYDWPADHWGHGEFPLLPRDFLLAWEGGDSSVIAGAWEDKFNDEIDNNRSHFRVVWSATLEDSESLAADPSSHMITAKFSCKSGWSEQRDYAMIISCVGAGLEQTTIGSYSGLSFWGDDSLADENLGMPAFMTPKVLISGSGDGALQDFLRIVTSKESAKAIFSALPRKVQAAARRLIASNEDYYQRSHVWSGNYNRNYRGDDCLIQSSLHRHYLYTVDTLLSEYKGKLRRTIDLMLRGFPGLHIELAFEGDHFAHCYPLNHFLVLLLATYLERKFKRRILLPNTRIVSVRGTNAAHKCESDKPADCDEKSHEADFITADCSTPRGLAGGRPMVNSPYNLIIVRHGIKPNKYLFGRPAANPRQMLPYDLID